MKKILIVEDDSKIASALKLRMTSAGYQTELAADAIQGIRQATTFEPDLVVLDVNIPAGNGIDMAHQLRQLLPASLPIIFLTASKHPGLVERASEVSSPVSFIEKPYDPQALMATTRRCLGEA